MRWLFLILTFAFTFVAFSTSSPGMLGLSMVLILLFGFLAVLGFAQARIEANSQPQASMIGAHEVKLMRQQGLQKKVAHNRMQQQTASGGYVGDSGASSYGGGDRKAPDSHHDGGHDGGGGDGGGGD